MGKILLVEPGYPNKYPPIGLMKIATFHRNRGDQVVFYKGEAPYHLVSLADRIYITTLFTFHYDLSIKCIQHYAKYASKRIIYVGGIAATLLSKQFKKDTGVDNIVTGQLTDSALVGYSSSINIDTLPLDYDILDDIPYEYPAGDNYFVYTTRGCPRKCDFCAVKTLEPEYKTTNNIIEQVSRVDETYGKKRNLLIMDNNILFSSKLKSIVRDIYSLGFDKTKNYTPPNYFKTVMNKIHRRINLQCNYERQLDLLLAYLDRFKSKIARYKNAYSDFDDIYKDLVSGNTWDKLLKHEAALIYFTDKFSFKQKLMRYVDFNQGIDARLLDDTTVKIISRLPISPFRLAFDSIHSKGTFVKAMNLALKNGIADFSNYILYNWEDRPEDLWLRLHCAMTTVNTSINKIKYFSFPMKYAPIYATDRSYVGPHWNKKYLSAVNVILNVTKGVVTKEIDFFYEAFGRDLNEYFVILTMPDEFIRHRHFFRDNGLLSAWKCVYEKLSSEEQALLISILCDAKTDRRVLGLQYTSPIDQILEFYKLNKGQFDRGEKTAYSIINRSTDLFPASGLR